jgi:hypothetical protein
MAWSFDIAQALRDGSPVILAFAGKTFKSRWNKNKVDPDNWSMLTHKQVPDAWMPWPEAPVLPRSDAGLDIVHRHSEINLPILDDVGSGA